MKLIKQEDNYTCACASFRMVLDHLEMEVPTEKEMIEFFDTDPKRGTTEENIILSASQDFGLKVLTGEDSNIERVENLRQRGYVVLLIVSVDVPHLVVYNGHNGNHIELYDPAFGILHLNKKKFESNKQYHPQYRWRALKEEFADLKGFELDHFNNNKAFIAFKKRKNE